MFLDDKLSVVDVKAKDSEGGLYQIEIQLLTYRHLPERMVYTWCDIISQQLQSGNDYSLLKPVYSIWLLAENLLPGETEYAHECKLQNRQGRTLADLGGIHLLELKLSRRNGLKPRNSAGSSFSKMADNWTRRHYRIG
ncbi:MAG: PD-(D/E)XK nuclease family transposase [Proteobacteria bacterium]|nr:PD-(D/E)XK nuclease family transposase [Pseudomonadota bacterium]